MGDNPKGSPPPGEYKGTAPHKVAKPSGPPIHEMWSAISPGGLGLKAGFWTGKNNDPMTFRPIVGWITVTFRRPPFNDDNNPPKNDLFAVVISDLMLPTLAVFLPNQCGVFLKDMPAEQAKGRAREWMNRPPAELQPTMPMGKA